jgi:hypothetical protein
MKSTAVIIATLTATIIMGLAALTFAGNNTPDVETAIRERRVDPSVRLVTTYREVNEKELAWFSTWHESDDLIYDQGGIVVYYNDTQEGADYVWVYEVN